MLRKAKINIGESCLVTGLGILGLFAVQFASLSGAYSVIGADFLNDRRELANHSARSKEVFAVGAVNAALFLESKAPGVYSMRGLVASK